MKIFCDIFLRCLHGLASCISLQAGQAKWADQCLNLLDLMMHRIRMAALTADINTKDDRLSQHQMLTALRAQTSVGHDAVTGCMYLPKQACNLR